METKLQVSSGKDVEVREMTLITAAKKVSLAI